MEIKSKRCKICNSAMTYIRIKTSELVCKQCGNISKLKVKNGNN